MEIITLIVSSIIILALVFKAHVDDMATKEIIKKLESIEFSIDTQDEYIEFIEELQQQLGNMLMITNELTAKEKEMILKRFDAKVKKQGEQVKSVMKRMSKGNVSLIDAVIAEIDSARQKEASKKKGKQSK